MGPTKHLFWLILAGLLLSACPDVLYPPARAVQPADRAAHPHPPHPQKPIPVPSPFPTPVPPTRLLTPEILPIPPGCAVVDEIAAQTAPSLLHWTSVRASNMQDCKAWLDSVRAVQGRKLADPGLFSGFYGRDTTYLSW